MFVQLNYKIIYISLAICGIIASSYVLFSSSFPFADTKNTGRFIMFSSITNIYNKKTKGPTLMEMFTATEKAKQHL